MKANFRKANESAITTFNDDGSETRTIEHIHCIIEDETGARIGEASFRSSGCNISLNSILFDLEADINGQIIALFKQ